jgi:hypothetical protein
MNSLPFQSPDHVLRGTRSRFTASSYTIAKPRREFAERLLEDTNGALPATEYIAREVSRHPRCRGEPGSAVAGA